MKQDYSCIFFDLDHTLWDYERNSMEALLELYTQFDLRVKGVTDFDSFYQRFRMVNLQLWDLYDTGKIGSEVIRQERFKQVLEPFGLHDKKLGEDISHDYLLICPKKNNLMPHAIDTLEYLHGKYTLTVVTNGFEEIQNIKLSSGNLHQYFDHIITSQKAGHRKPAREIFDFALKSNAAACHQAIMIGDNLIADMGGSRNASIDNIFFNPNKNQHESFVTHEICSLAELREIL